MGLGVLEPNTTAHVPGTVLLDQQAAHSEDQTGRLKHGTGKNSHIVLAPQPSEDPNDPLNWSSLKKHIVLAVIFFGVIIQGVIPVSKMSYLFFQPHSFITRPGVFLTKQVPFLLYHRVLFSMPASSKSRLI